MPRLGGGRGPGRGHRATKVNQPRRDPGVERERGSSMGIRGVGVRHCPVSANAEAGTASMIVAIAT